jgi:hypothetical protein
VKTVYNLGIVNLTPHAIVIRRAGIEDVTFPASGKVSRVNSIPMPDAEVNNISVVRNSFSDTKDLPAEEFGTAYIVSMLVAQANPRRQDLLVPDTSPDGAIRDGKGQIIAVRGFQTFATMGFQAIPLPPDGMEVFRATSVYFGSHPEMDESDYEVILAVPKGRTGEVKLQHGHFSHDVFMPAGTRELRNGTWQVPDL